MKNARPTPKSKVGAPGTGAAIVTRPAKSGNSAGEPAALVTVEHGQPMTDSLLVAAEFGKLHKNVMRAIDALQVDLSPEFWRLNFEPSNYTDGRGTVDSTEKGPAVRVCKHCKGSGKGSLSGGEGDEIKLGVHMLAVCDEFSASSLGRISRHLRHS